ncbi:MAG: NAD(P)-dependent oxidoreductase, partial [Acetobacteraceae bacterium]|nr:NAD(P)-dependent oxidoreductase [Acetobacteraceae bacterium]
AQTSGLAELDFRPPFTTKQLEALVTTHDVFAVADWPRTFDVRPTPLREAMDITFRDRRRAPVALEA